MQWVNDFIFFGTLSDYNEQVKYFTGGQTCLGGWPKQSRLGLAGVAVGKLHYNISLAACI